jgi:hypothetical protein
MVHGCHAALRACTATAHKVPIGALTEASPGFEGRGPVLRTVVAALQADVPLYPIRPRCPMCAPGQSATAWLLWPSLAVYPPEWGCGWVGAACSLPLLPPSRSSLHLPAGRAGVGSAQLAEIHTALKTYILSGMDVMTLAQFVQGAEAYEFFYHKCAFVPDRADRPHPCLPRPANALQSLPDAGAPMCASAVAAHW